VLVALLVESGPRAPFHGVALVHADGTSVTFRNRQGSWTIFLRCLGPRAHGGRDLTVGPGYVARVVRAVDGATVSDDERPVGGGNAPGNGGLGMFGWHGSRRHGTRFDYADAWSIDGRSCARDSWAYGRPFRSGVGVVGTRVLAPPRLLRAGREGRLALETFLGDNHLAPGRALVRVRYRYRVLPRVVLARIDVTERCGHGRCGSGGRAFVKEPKLLAAVDGGGYTRMVVFGRDGRIARNALERNRDGGWSSLACVWMGVNARDHTGQCDADDRVRVRFDFGDYASGGDGRCGRPGRCLDVTMRALRADGRPAPWEGSGVGLDGWARASGTRRAYAATDSRLDGVRWSCKGPSLARPATPSSPLLRRWELVGYRKDGRGRYTAATAMFHAWEGGRGYGDCEPDARLFGPRGETWSVEAAYAFS
jgi:hypothetical protein